MPQRRHYKVIHRAGLKRVVSFMKKSYNVVKRLEIVVDLTKEEKQESLKIER